MKVVTLYGYLCHNKNNVESLIIHDGARHICKILNLVEFEYEEAAESCIDV